MGEIRVVDEAEQRPVQGERLPERGLSDADREALERAVLTLERPSLAARLSALAGRPLELIGRSLPAVVTDRVNGLAEAALNASLRAALTTLPENRRWSSPLLHRALAAASGASADADYQQAKPYLDSLDFLAVGSGSEDDRAVGRFVIGLK